MSSLAPVSRCVVCRYTRTPCTGITFNNLYRKDHNYDLKHVKEYLQTLVEVQDIHSVALALTNGSLIRLDAENIDNKTTAVRLFHAF